jgi:hypothetical protein
MFSAYAAGKKAYAALLFGSTEMAGLKSSSDILALAVWRNRKSSHPGWSQRLANTFRRNVSGPCEQISTLSNDRFESLGEGARA